MPWEIISSVIALLSLIVNFLQYRKNKRLSNIVKKYEQKAGGNIETSEQSHSGTGDNINIKGDTNLSK